MRVVKQIISTLIIPPYGIPLAAYVHAHTVWPVPALAFVMEFPARPAADIFFPDIQFCTTLVPVRADIPVTEAITRLCGGEPDCAYDAVYGVSLDIENYCTPGLFFEQAYLS